jgi:transcriptional regulator with XRE-family HTH domain
MSGFKSKKILEINDQLAYALRQARLDQGLELSELAKDLQIKLSYLEALEGGAFEQLPEGVYGRNLLREYARRLGLKGEEILSLFDSGQKPRPKKISDPFSRKLPPIQYFFRLPKLFRNFLIALIALICFGYIGYYFLNISAPPKITLLYPLEDTTITDSSIKVEGKAELETEILINDDPILQDAEGYFFRVVNLKPGLNVITIVGQKKYSREQRIIRNIKVVTDPEKNNK